MRIVVLLCTIWLTGCTHTKVTRATLFHRAEESRFHRGVLKDFKDEPWVSVSASIISYPADQSFISTRELEGNRRTQAFQQYKYFQFGTEGYSFMSPEQASEIRALADKLDAVQFIEMPRQNVLVSNSGASFVRTGQGLSVWLRTLTASGSSATIKYNVKREIGGTSQSDWDADWEMSGETELNLGVCYLRTVATDDPQLKVAVLLRLLSVSQPDQKESIEG